MKESTPKFFFQWAATVVSVFALFAVGSLVAWKLGRYVAQDEAEEIFTVVPAIPVAEKLEDRIELSHILDLTYPEAETELTDMVRADRLISMYNHRVWMVVVARDLFAYSDRIHMITASPDERWYMRGFSSYFPTSEKEKLMTVKRGELIIVECTFRQLNSGDPRFEDCIFIKKFVKVLGVK